MKNKKILVIVITILLLTFSFNEITKKEVNVYTPKVQEKKLSLTEAKLLDFKVTGATLNSNNTFNGDIKNTILVVITSSKLNFSFETIFNSSITAKYSLNDGSKTDEIINSAQVIALSLSPSRSHLLTLALTEGTTTNEYLFLIEAKYEGDSINTLFLAASNQLGELKGNSGYYSIENTYKHVTNVNQSEQGCALFASSNKPGSYMIRNLKIEGVDIPGAYLFETPVGYTPFNQNNEIVFEFDVYKDGNLFRFIHLTMKKEFRDENDYGELLLDVNVLNAKLNGNTSFNQTIMNNILVVPNSLNNLNFDFLVKTNPSVTSISYKIDNGQEVVINNDTFNNIEVGQDNSYVLTLKVESTTLSITEEYTFIIERDKEIDKNIIFAVLVDENNNTIGNHGGFFISNIYEHTTHVTKDSNFIGVNLSASENDLYDIRNVSVGSITFDYQIFSFNQVFAITPYSLLDKDNIIIKLEVYRQNKLYRSITIKVVFESDPTWENLSIYHNNTSNLLGSYTQAFYNQQNPLIVEADFLTSREFIIDLKLLNSPTYAKLIVNNQEFDIYSEIPYTHTVNISASEEEIVIRIYTDCGYFEETYIKFIHVPPIIPPQVMFTLNNEQTDFSNYFVNFNNPEPNSVITNNDIFKYNQFTNNIITLSLSHLLTNDQIKVYKVVNENKELLTLDNTSYNLELSGSNITDDYIYDQFLIIVTKDEIEYEYHLKILRELPKTLDEFKSENFLFIDQDSLVVSIDRITVDDSKKAINVKISPNTENICFTIDTLKRLGSSVWYNNQEVTENTIFTSGQYELTVILEDETRHVVTLNIEVVKDKGSLFTFNENISRFLIIASIVSTVIMLIITFFYKDRFINVIKKGRNDIKREVRKS